MFLETLSPYDHVLAEIIRKIKNESSSLVNYILNLLHVSRAIK